MNKDYARLAESLIKRSSKVLIGSLDADGFPNIKVMLAPRERNGIKEFYFTTNTSSMRVAQFRMNPKASLYVYNERFYKGLMLKGTMEVILDQKVKDRIWRDGDEMYYPLGVTDPDYCVFKFISRSGRYYENFSSNDFAID
jgi:general stress protein 26